LPAPRLIRRFLELSRCTVVCVTNRTMKGGAHP
jgi:hypothetical protein